MRIEDWLQELKAAAILIGVASFFWDLSVRLDRTSSRQAADVIEARPPAEHSTYRVNCAIPTGREEADLCAQQAMAEAAKDMYRTTWYQLLVNVFGLATVAYSLVLTRRAVMAAANTYEVSRNSLITENRAWISFNVSVVSEFEYFEKVAGCEVAIKNSNFGRTPAYDVQTSVKMIVPKDVEQASKLLAELGRVSLKSFNKLYGRMVMPGETYNRSWFATVDRDDMCRDPDLPGFDPFLLVCISYRILGDDNIHQTAKAYLMAVRHPFDSDYTNRFEFQKCVDPEDIVLTEYSGGFAD